MDRENVSARKEAGDATLRTITTKTLELVLGKPSMLCLLQNSFRVEAAVLSFNAKKGNISLEIEHL